MNLDNIGKFIKEMRKNKNLTQEELAEKLGVNNRTVSRWENGKNMPDISLYKPLCEVLGISIEELVNGELTNKKNISYSVEKAIINTVSSSKKEKSKMSKIIKFLSVLVIVTTIFVVFVVVYYKKKYHDLIKTMDLTKFNKEELEILKKAFGNNLNIGYLNTLSNTEEEKFITLINKYCSEKEKSNSKLNEKIKELAKDIPINYRLALDLYLGFYDGKKYTVDELSLILNLPAYEIKTRIKNGIIYIKNILNTKDLESQKELNTLIKSL